MRLSFAALVIAVTFPASLLAAPPNLALNHAPEQPVSPPSLVRAPYAQTTPSAASTGEGFEVAWIDQRGSDSRPYLAQTIYATHVDDAGNVSPATSTKIAAGYTTAVASNGTGYVLAYNATNGDVYTIELRDDGTIASQPHLISAPGDTSVSVLSVASNGRSYPLALGSSSPDTLRLFVLDDHGVPVKQLAQQVSRSGASSLKASIVVMDGQYHVLHTAWEFQGDACCVATIYDDAIDEKSGTRTTRQLLSGFGGDYQVTATATANRLLVAFASYAGYGSTGQTVLSYVVADSKETIIASNPVAVKTPTECVCGFTASAGWDGTKFMIAFGSAANPAAPQLFGIRVNPDGGQIDASPVVIADSFQTKPAFALSRTEQLLVWSTGGSPSDWLQSDLVGRIAPSFDDMTERVDEFPIARSSPSQQQADAAPLGNGVITVWRELGEGSSIHASTSGQPIVVAPPSLGAQDSPAVAANSDVALVVWWKYASDLSRAELLGRRVRPDGAFLDAQPIGIASVDATLFWGPGGHIGVASDGHDFLVVWPEGDYRLHARRVRADGSLAEASAITISRPLDRFTGVASDPHVIWTGEVYLIAWRVDPNLPGIATPWIAAVNVAAARVTRDGVLLDVQQSLSLYHATGSTGGVAMARTSDRIVLAWSRAPVQPSSDPMCVMTLVIASDGAPTQSAPMPVYCRSDLPFDLSAAGSGNEVLLIGTNQRHSVVALDLNADGQPVGSTLTTISPEGAYAYDAAIAAVGKRYSITYARTADDVYGGVGRLFSVLTSSPERGRAMRP